MRIEQKIIRDLNGEAFLIDQLRSKQNLERFLKCSRDSLNKMLSWLAEEGHIRPHIGRRYFNNKEVKVILAELDGTDIENDV